VAVRPVATISAAIDHRSYDGSHAGRLLAAVRAYLEDPGAFDPAP
jgi:pyruvate/2-oxoglutarate dehydrogenase complex dihydrolipoamide acyltransferase (E2) component